MKRYLTNIIIFFLINKRLMILRNYNINENDCQTIYKVNKELKIDKIKFNKIGNDIYKMEGILENLYHENLVLSNVLISYILDDNLLTQEQQKIENVIHIESKKIKSFSTNIKFTDIPFEAILILEITLKQENLNFGCYITEFEFNN